MARRIRFPIAALAALLLCFCGKEPTVAGGYDDVENPAVKVSLLDSLGRPYGAGQVLVYARYQNPLKDAEPLLTRSLPQGAKAGIRDTALLAAMGRAKGRGTPWTSPDTVEFNLVASDPGGEAFLGQFLLVKSPAGTFGFRRMVQGSVTYPDAKGSLEALPRLMAPVLNQRGRVGDRGMQLGLKSVFIPGSPYRAQIADDGSFAIPRLASGRYEMKAISQDAKVYSAADSLRTGTEFVPSDWSEADLIWIE